MSGQNSSIYGARLTRRSLLQSGGALMVGFGLASPACNRHAALPKNTLDATVPGSWIEIRPDNTIILRTGKSDFGQGTAYTAYRQIVAEELSASLDSVSTVVTGDTDRTPDGSGAFDFLGSGMPNIRKAAAYTYQALLDLAARRFHVPKEQIEAHDGVFSAAGQTVTYGQLVQGNQLKLTIPVTGSLTSIGGLTVTGDPPLKPPARYTIIGKPSRNPVIASKVAAKEQWVTDVRLPGMLHARMVHPKTLGSTLVSAGQVDRSKFPTSQAVVKGNLVGVVAATEWEAILAAEQVARDTKWSEWKGLPGQANLFQHLRAADWKSTPVSNGSKNKGEADPALASAARRLSAAYELPYMKHAPMGPTVAIADARPDGTVTVHTHNQNPQALRGELAQMLGVPLDNIIVRCYSGPGHYGRSNGGNAGAEDEAVILSRAVGKPVRVHWMRPEDLQWSTQSPAAYSEIEIALDSAGKMAACRMDHYMPAGQDDRPIGAVLAGLPTMPAPDVKAPPDSFQLTLNDLADPWLYDKVPVLQERAHGTFQVGQKASPIAVGLRDHSMRTPGQFQQNYPRELALNEAAALAKVDPIQFRLDHTTDARLTAVLHAVREASGWKPRPSPASHTSGATLRGRGVSAMLRSATWWACVCEIAVTPATGVIKVEKYTIAVDPGIVINPLQLKRQVEGGAVMGISHALLEEVPFDESGITCSDWALYPILTMDAVPQIEVVLLHNPASGVYGGGSEAANALAAPAIAAALHDATGRVARRLPLRPAYVKTLLHG
jgi:nicotinate dehydrogenase subunit B